MKIKKCILLTTLSIVSLASCGKKDAENIITSYKDLLVAISNSNDGDTIYVGDIDFSVEDGLHKSISRIQLEKSITIQSGYAKRNAVFTSGSFNIVGTRVAGEALECSFSNIDFDGGIDGALLKDSSWVYTDSSDTEPRIAQYAMSFKGNISSKYNSCSFKNYMSEQGAAFWAYYGDHSSNQEFQFLYGDNSTCRLNIETNNCSFLDNYSYYGGGALYLEGNQKNVTFTTNNTLFKNNHSSCMEYTMGGGAILMHDISATISECTFEDNNGSYSYGSTQRTNIDYTGVPPEFIDEYESMIQDQTRGGAIAAVNTNLDIKETDFFRNTASLGGGIYSNNAKLSIDGCSFIENEANCDLLKNSTFTSDNGPWSMMGLGGAIYINSNNGTLNDIWNSSFYRNKARNGYPAIHTFYNGSSDGDILVYPIVNINYSTFLDNETILHYDDPSDSNPLWKAIPGDFFAIPHVTTKASIICDSFYTDYFYRYESPKEENNYNYITNKENLIKDSLEIIINPSNQLEITSTGNIDLTISETFREETKLRYQSYDGSFIIGTNYTSALFHTKEPKKNTTALVITLSSVGSLLLLGIVCFVIIYTKKKKNPEPIVVQDSAIPEVVAEEAIEAPISNLDIIAAIELEHKLTEREKDVLTLLLAGKKRIEIANELFLSESSIKKYTAQIYDKLEVHSKVELIMKYKIEKKNQD